MKLRMKLLLRAVIIFSLLILLSCDDNSNNNSTKPNQTVNPIFSPASGVYNTVLQVEINTSTEDAEIYYTLDDSEPTEASQLYTEPINVISTVTIKARAYKDNYQPSDIITAEYEIVLPQVATPTFTPTPGNYVQAQLVSISCSTEGAEIRYTIDGSEPSQSSPMYENPLDINTNTTLKALAFKENYPPSEVAVGIYEITNQTVSIPVFNPTPGVYSEGQSITLQCYTTGAEIYYTLDSSNPTVASLLYSTPININSTTTIKAFAVKENFTPSIITSAEYVINYEVVATPTFKPASWILLSTAICKVTHFNPRSNNILHSRW